MLVRNSCITWNFIFLCITLTLRDNIKEHQHYRELWKVETLSLSHSIPYCFCVHPLSTFPVGSLISTVLLYRKNLSIEPSRGVFCRHFEDFMNNQDVCMVNLHGSIVFDLLSVAVSFGMIDEVVSMVRMGHVWSKEAWKKKVCMRAWELDLCYWRVQERCHKSLDILARVSGGPKYSIWWMISDGYHGMMRSCEVMIKLVTHSSLLKDDGICFWVHLKMALWRVSKWIHLVFNLFV